MPTTEERAAAALRASMAINQGQQHLTDESRVLLAGLLRDEMKDAVAAGIQTALANEALWATVFAVLQKQATERTGRWVLGGLAQIVKKAIWAGGLALLAYYVGGWVFLKAVWAAMTKGTP